MPKSRRSILYTLLDTFMVGVVLLSTACAPLPGLAENRGEASGNGDMGLQTRKSPDASPLPGARAGTPDAQGGTPGERADTPGERADTPGERADTQVGPYVPNTQLPNTQVPTPEPTNTQSPTPQLPPSATPDTRLPPEDWQEWSIIPTVSGRARQIYQQGLAAGNNPAHFSKIGDCQNISSHFLAAFDAPGQFVLGPQYAGLQPVLQAFAGSWGRESQAVRPGYNVAAVLSAFQADPKACQGGESPLACEVRLYNPSIALVSMETWYVGQKLPDYEKYLRQVIDFLLSKHVLPILATKADNLEGDQIINRAIARLAYEYDLPLWNFWRAVQPLPGHGLVEDGFHLTRDPAHPEDPLCYRRLSDAACTGQVSWAVRNLTAVQVFGAVWQGASQ